MPTKTLINREFVMTDRATVFPDIDGWVAVRMGQGQPRSMYSIYDKYRRHVAFTGFNGTLSVVTKSGNFSLTDRKFASIKQAVRYAYLLLQKPKRKPLLAGKL